MLSPGTAARDWQDKFDLYPESGVGEYWIVLPLEQDITVFVLEDSLYRRVGEYAQPGPVPCATLPGLALDWGDIFTEPAR